MKREIEQLIKHQYIQQGAENSLLNANNLKNILFPMS